MRPARASVRLLALAGALVGIGLAWLATGLSAANGRPPEVFLPGAISGTIYVLAGAAMFLRQPSNPIGPVLVASVAASSTLVACRYLWPASLPLNFAYGSVVGDIALAFVVLTFPLGVFERRSERAAFWLVAAIGLLAGTLELVVIEPAISRPDVCPPCEANPFRLFDPRWFGAVETLNTALLLVAIFVVTFVLVRRRSLARGLTRRALTPIVAGGVIYAIAVMVLVVASQVLGSGAVLAGQALLLIRLLLPVGLAIVFLRFYSARSEVARSLLRLGPGTTMPALEDALQQSLSDPSIRILPWSTSAANYVTAAGLPAEPAPAGGESVLTVERDGQPVAAVIHDQSLDADEELLGVIAETVRYSAQVSELQQELFARGGDVDRLPKGEVTFLFGDVERSTELLQRLGERYAGAIATLREIVRRSTDENAGHVVDMRADECFLAFASPSTAVAAARRIQAGIAATGWPDDTRLRLRIGLHTGRPELTADGYVGLDVHHAARVMASAMGGQIIASQALVQALGSGTPEGVSLSALGTFELRGIPGKEVLYEVGAA